MEVGGIHRGVADDSGKRVRLLKRAALERLRWSDDPRIAALGERMRSAMAPRRPLKYFLFFFAYLIGLLVLGVLLAKLWPEIGVLALTLPLAGLFAYAIIVDLGQPTDAATVARLMLEEGLCPCCGYNLAGSRDAGDERVACAECGASWKAARIARALPILEKGDADPISRFMRASETGGGGKDDRGVRVRMGVGVRLRGALRVEEDPGVRERLLAARAEMLRRGRAERVTMCAIGVLAALAAAVGMVVFSELVRASQGVVVFVLLLAFSAWSFFGASGLRWTTVRRTMLRRSLCPACAKPLDGLTPDEADGCVECGTCRAAWRVAPPTREPEGGSGGAG